MSGSLLHKYADLVTDPAADGRDGGLEDQEDFGAFGWARGMNGRSVMLELRMKTGNIVAIPYGWIDRLEFDPSEGITISAGGQKLRVKGRRLNAEVRPNARLFEGLTRQRVMWIREASGPELMAADESATIVESIE